jgi:hypothetical protein
MSAQSSFSAVFEGRSHLGIAGGSEYVAEGMIPMVDVAERGETFEITVDSMPSAIYHWMLFPLSVTSVTHVVLMLESGGDDRARNSSLSFVLVLPRAQHLALQLSSQFGRTQPTACSLSWS